MKFFHYSKNMKNILKHKFLLPKSFSKTNTYDFILEVCPELFLNKKEINKFECTNPKKRKDYESKYSSLDLKFKNKLLQEFFGHNKYILAFDEKLTCRLD